MASPPCPCLPFSNIEVLQRASCWPPGLSVHWCCLTGAQAESASSPEWGCGDSGRSWSFSKTWRQQLTSLGECEWEKHKLTGLWASSGNLPEHLGLPGSPSTNLHATAKEHIREATHNSRPAVWGKDTHPTRTGRHCVPNLPHPMLCSYQGLKLVGFTRPGGGAFQARQRVQAKEQHTAGPQWLSVYIFPRHTVGSCSLSFLSPLLAPVQWETMAHGEADCLGSHTMSHPRSIRSRPKRN